MAPFDYIVCATKTVPEIGPQTADVLRPAVTPGHSVIVLIQNGLNIELPLLEAFPDNIVLSGISMCGSAETEPGTIDHTRQDELGIGPFRDTEAARERAEDFVARYSAAGRCSCWVDTNVAFSRWRKLLYNAVINPTCAVTGLDTGDMQLCPGLVDEVVRPAMQEIQAAAAAHGHQLTDEAIEDMIVSDPIESHIPPSMLNDVRKVSFTASHFISYLALTPPPTGAMHRTRESRWRTAEGRKSSTSFHAGTQQSLLSCPNLSMEGYTETFGLSPSNSPRPCVLAYSFASAMHSTHRDGLAIIPCKVQDILYLIYYIIDSFRQFRKSNSLPMPARRNSSAEGTGSISRLSLSLAIPRPP